MWDRLRGREVVGSSPSTLLFFVCFHTLMLNVRISEKREEQGIFSPKFLIFWSMGGLLFQKKAICPTYVEKIRWFSRVSLEFFQVFPFFKKAEESCNL